ncbi:MAG: hypothetical protein JWO19_1492 [Bryobacterales bacterium]|jgi:hypothetical protein|nr:hypothetical protein [Bryobacterales bacterium]
MEQRYVSDELTHFVGQHQSTDEDRFAILVEILTSGLLKAPPLTADPTQDLTAQTVVGGTSFSGRDMYRSSVVCFCDIPLADFALHMGKYSRFGLSFTKRTLLQKGANPVFYVANDSIVRERLPSARNTEWQGKPFSEYPRQQYLDRLMSVLEWRRSQLFSRLARSCNAPDPSPQRLNDDDFSMLFQLEVLLRAVDKHLVSFCVPFTADRPDDHNENYYFEREWRALGSINFELAEVHRILLPKSFAAALRDRVPGYVGQIHFTDAK